MIKEGLQLASAVASIIDNATSVEKKALRLFVKSYVKMAKRKEKAEQIFIGKGDTMWFGDDSFAGTDGLFKPRKSHPNYWRLRDRFVEGR